MTLLRRHTLLTGRWHPKYRDVLLRAIGQSYNMPSLACMKLQDQLVRDLHTDGTWNDVDYLFVHASDAPDANMMRINWRQPLNDLSTGSPTVVAKKGMTGFLSHNGFDVATDRIAMNAGGVNEYPASMFVYITTGGTTPSLDAVAQINDTTLSRVHAIRHRNTPRTEAILNTGFGTLFTVEASNPTDNTLYHVELSSIAASLRRTTTINGTSTEDIGGSAGICPKEGVVTCEISSPKVLGIVGGGGGIRANSHHVLLNTRIQAYMAAVQLLP